MISSLQLQMTEQTVIEPCSLSRRVFPMSGKSSVLILMFYISTRVSIVLGEPDKNGTLTQESAIEQTKSQLQTESWTQNETIKAGKPACECCPWKIIRHNPCSDSQSDRESFDREELTLRFYTAAQHDRERIELALNVALNTVGIGIGLAPNKTTKDMCKQSEMDELSKTEDEPIIIGWTINFQQDIGKPEIQANSYSSQTLIKSLRIESLNSGNCPIKSPK